MKSFLGNNLAPLTFSIGFVEAPLEAVADAYVARMNARFSHSMLNKLLIRITRPIIREDISAPLEKTLQRLAPLQKLSPNRHLFTTTETGWTAVFHNDCSGTTYEVASLLADTLDCRAVSTKCCPDTLSSKPPGSKGGMWASVQFVLFQGKGGIRNTVRSVAVVQDGPGSWDFETNGEVQPFEKVDNYRARKKRERFTKSTRWCHQGHVQRNRCGVSTAHFE